MTDGFSLMKTTGGPTNSAFTVSTLGVQPSLRYVDANGFTVPLGMQFNSSLYYARKVDYSLSFVKMNFRF